MNETDRELLMWAAKAAGIECGIIHGEIRIRCDAGWTPWNPLTDDGDALRLAVKLGLFSYEIIPDELSMAFLQDDPYAATRRAIVLVAAEIGRNMI